MAFIFKQLIIIDDLPFLILVPMVILTPIIPAIFKSVYFISILHNNKLMY
jgi:hypothetical protein